MLNNDARSNIILYLSLSFIFVLRKYSKKVGRKFVHAEEVSKTRQFLDYAIEIFRNKRFLDSMFYQMKPKVITILKH